MLSRDCRPQVFKDVAGQELTVRCLKAIIANPTQSPKSIILSGPFGTGKCRLGSDRIATPFGYQPLKDVCEKMVGGLLKDGFTDVSDSHNQVLGYSCVRDVQHVFKQSNAFVKRIWLKNGEFVTGTPEHPVLVYNPNEGEFWGNASWKKIEDIEPGDMVLRNNAPLLYGDYIPEKHLKMIAQHAKHVRSGRGVYGLELALESILNAHPDNRFTFYKNLFSWWDFKSVTIKGDKFIIEWLDSLCQSLGIIPELNFLQGVIKIPKIDSISYNMSFDEVPGCECYGKGNRQFLKKDIFISNKDLEKWIGQGVETWNEMRRRDVEGPETEFYYRWTPIEVVGSDAFYADVYDVSMDDFHDFYCGGVINHNTTNARILAKGLNCLGSGEKPCGKCVNCTRDLETAGFYQEYDSAIIGSVDKIRELRDSFYVSMGSGYRVICLDESHLCSRQSQSALLKVLEEAPKSIFFVFCTTEVDKILPTIVSRSLDLQLELIPEQKIYNSIKTLAEKFHIPASDEALNLIVTAAHGHMRNAHMLLDKLSMVGEDDFKASLKSSSDAIFRYFESIAQRSNSGLFSSVQEILTYPVSEVGTSFLNEVRLLTRAMVGVENKYSALAKTLGQDCLKLVKLCVSEWVTTSFVSDPQIEVALICIFNLMMGSKPQSVSESAQPVNRFSRR